MVVLPLAIRAATFTFNESQAAQALLEKQYTEALTQSYKAALTDINRQISETFIKYGQKGVLTMEQMARRDGKVSRLQRLIDRVNEDLNVLNRGRPQQLAGHLTSVYEVNWQDATKTIKGVVPGVDFGLFNRDMIYRSAISPMAKIGLETNAQAVRTNIRRDITQSIVQGEGIDQMSRRIQTSLETNANNAERIARTETTRIAGEAKMDVMNRSTELGIPLQKMWIASADEKTRPSHQITGELVDPDKKFSNGLMFPGDESGPAKEVINCRCALGSRVVFDDESEEPIAKPGRKRISKETIANALKPTPRKSAKQTYRQWNLSGFDDESKRQIEDRMAYLMERYGLQDHADKLSITSTSSERIFGKFQWGFSMNRDGTISGSNDLFFAKKYMGNIQTASQIADKNSLAVGQLPTGTFLNTVDHEFAHYMDYMYSLKTNGMLDDYGKYLGDFMLDSAGRTKILEIAKAGKSYSLSNRLFSEMSKDYKSKAEFLKVIKSELGSYAATCHQEFLAEAMMISAHLPPDKITPFVAKTRVLVEQYWNEVMIP